jgi:hypothetical protein
MDTQTYKKIHRPRPLQENDKGKPHQGIYIPKNPNKVIGGEIITRSSWEMAFARWCDDSPSVIEWGCEVISIQYRDPSGIDLDSCMKFHTNPADPLNWPVHDYYPDFYIKVQSDNEDGTTTEKSLLIEIKPRYQTERPETPAIGAKLKEVKRYNTLVKTYLQNVKKWESAIKWCTEHNMEFRVFTEITLQSMGII